MYFVERSDEKNLFDSQLPFNFGIEPLSEKFNENYIYLISRKVNMPIKAWLMKGIIAGIGNIYASEALFRAGINPNAKTKSLGIIRMSRLVNSIKFVLTEAIRSGGSTINNYSNIDGEAGNYAKKHMVYGRKDKFCLICNYMLDTKYIAQRSSFYCKKCQKF